MQTWQGPSSQTAQARRSLQQYVDQAFPTSDYVLLCTFILEPATERTSKQLRRALRAAGFPGAAAGHLIRNSPLLYRNSTRRYRLREFQPDG